MATLEIVVTKGPSRGVVIPLDGTRAITIGRSPENVLILKDTKVSSRHAQIDMTKQGAVLTDLGSKNGTFVSGQSIVGSFTLRPGMDVLVGNSVIELRMVAQEGGVSIGGFPGARHQIRAKIDTVRDLVMQHPRDGAGGRNMTKAQRNLAVLHEVGALLSSERDEDSFLQRLMELIFAMLPADRGALLVIDDSGQPQARVTRVNDQASTQEINVSRTILSKVVEGGMSILTADAGSDARLAAGQSIIAQNIRSAMCVPIRGKQRTLGAIYVDTVLSIGVFGKDDLHVLTTVGIVAGTALENIELYRTSLQQARMAAIGQVIAGLGHDIRNMLTALRGGMYLLDEQLRDHPDADLRAGWDVVRHGQDSIAHLVQDMVNYSKPREPEWARADLNQVVLSAVSFAREQAREKGIQITELVDPTIGLFHFDLKSIERCLMNVLSNAIDAAPADTGIVSVATQPEANGDSVRIVVQDNGDGIAIEDQSRVFDLLFSTKGSRGTGFGLAITRKLVEEHGGEVLLDSQPGNGARFTIVLPLCEESPVPVNA